MLYPAEICTNKPELWLSSNPYPIIFPAAPWPTATKVAIKSWLVAIELHWPRLKQHCWGWRYSPDGESGILPTGLSGNEVNQAIGFKHGILTGSVWFFWHGHHGVLEISYNSLESKVFVPHPYSTYLKKSINYFRSSKRPSQSSICHPTTRLTSWPEKIFSDEMSLDQKAHFFVI